MATICTGHTRSRNVKYVIVTISTQHTTQKRKPQNDGLFLNVLNIQGQENTINIKPGYHKLLEDTAPYADLLLYSAQGFGLRPKFFLCFGQKKKFLTLLCTYFRLFMLFSSNIRNIL